MTKEFRPSRGRCSADPNWLRLQFAQPLTFGKNDAELERLKFQVFYIGVDEVGVGPWAGPLTSCAFHMRRRRIAYAGIRDSKTIKDPLEMKRLHDMLTEHKEHSYALGEVSHTEIDETFHGNNRAARLQAMTLAVQALQAKLRMEAARNGMSPYWKLMIDGDACPIQLASSVTQMKLIVKGDSKILEISAASIIAKWTRDNIMRTVWDVRFPQYGFRRHVGYGVPEHQRALYLHGACACHRRSFSPIRKIEEARHKNLPNPYKEREKKTAPKKRVTKTTKIPAAVQVMNELGTGAQRIKRKEHSLTMTAEQKSEFKAKLLQTKIALTKRTMCTCEVHEHVDQTQAPNDDDLEDMEIESREWEAHTQAYRDAWTKMADKIDLDPNCQMNSTDGEIHKDEWQTKHHPKLCCALRHFAPSRGLCWSE